MNAPRERAAQLLRRDARLIQGLRFDQVSHRFRLRQIQAAGKKRSLSEFPRPRQARASAQGEAHQHLKNHRRAVCGNLDHIFAGVGMGPGEIRNNGLI